MIRNLLALVLCGLALGWLMGMSVSPVVQNVLTAVLAVVVSVLGLLAGVPPKTEGQPARENKGRVDTPNVETHVLGNVVTVLVENKPVTHDVGGEDTKEKSGSVKAVVAPKSTTLWPVAIFLVFLSIGSAGGVFTRTNDLLGVNKEQFLERWKTLMPRQSTHEDSTKLMSHLFYRLYGISPGTMHDGKQPIVATEAKGSPNPSTGLYASYSTRCDELRGRRGKEIMPILKAEENKMIQLLLTKNLTEADLEQIKQWICTSSDQ